MPAMALDEFFTILLVSWIRGQFLEKGGTPTHFSAPLYPNFEFSCLQQKS